MNTLWVILNEDRSEIVEVFETESSDSLRHWPKFFNHRAGNVFCRRSEESWRDGNAKGIWYANYFYWNDISRWGYETPDGMAWFRCMAIPEALKLLELLQ